MGNKIKTGLDYFPFDVSFFDDIKLRKLIKYQGCKAVSIYTLLLCNIYRDGYYLLWDTELPFTISEKTGYEESYVKEAITCCISVGLFSKPLYDQSQVLSSRGIQIRYELICKQLKRKCIISEYSLIDSEDMPIDSEEIKNDSEELLQRKGKENKTKERKANSAVAPELDSDFEKFWDLYQKKVDKVKCEKAFKKINSEARAKIFLKLPIYISATPEVNFRKNPLTWLNGQCWNDEIKIQMKAVAIPQTNQRKDLTLL